MSPRRLFALPACVRVQSPAAWHCARTHARAPAIWQHGGRGRRAEEGAVTGAAAAAEMLPPRPAPAPQAFHAHLQRGPLLYSRSCTGDGAQGARARARVWPQTPGRLVDLAGAGAHRWWGVPRHAATCHGMPACTTRPLCAHMLVPNTTFATTTDRGWPRVLAGNDPANGGKGYPTETINETKHAGGNVTTM